MDISRFTLAHRTNYSYALEEIRNGKKINHWMWYIFPQLRGLGHSSMSEFYGIVDAEEAKAFLQDDYLGSHLREISTALLHLPGNDARAVMGRPDDMKLRSCMTLFSIVAPDETVFSEVLKKYFDGRPDFRTQKMLGILTDTNQDENGVQSTSKKDRHIQICDDNILSLRQKYPNGLHFVVGDTHGEYATLVALMQKIEFDSQKDHVYFVGDYNAGGDSERLLEYISHYYQENPDFPGFHLIRGNHERELGPFFPLTNLPDVIVYKSRVMNYYIAHAGMVGDAFDLINEDIRQSAPAQNYAYALLENVAGFDAPFRQLTWSRGGLYSQRSHYHVWPSESSLHDAKACIIHGHTPFSLMIKGDYYGYGDRMLLWQNQKIWFAEDLQSFDIDSNIKGRYSEADSYRGLSCICLEILDEIAEKNNGVLTRDGIRQAENFVFAVPYRPNDLSFSIRDLSRILNAAPKMKRIGLNSTGKPCIFD